MCRTWPNNFLDLAQMADRVVSTKKRTPSEHFKNNAPTTPYINALIIIQA